MKRYFSIILTASVLMSCQHVYYVPNTANAPMLTEKGETRINAMYTTGGDSKYDGGELQFAHSVTRNIAILASFFSAGRTDDISDYSSVSHQESGKGSYFELGSGYFKTFGPENKWVFDTYAGFGTGNVKSDYGFYRPLKGWHQQVFYTAFHRLQVE